MYACRSAQLSAKRKAASPKRPSPAAGAEAPHAVQRADDDDDLLILSDQEASRDGLPAPAASQQLNAPVEDTQVSLAVRRKPNSSCRSCLRLP